MDNKHLCFFEYVNLVSIKYNNMWLYTLKKYSSLKLKLQPKVKRNLRANFTVNSHIVGKTVTCLKIAFIQLTFALDEIFPVNFYFDYHCYILPF